jgi:hypothetical protein
MFLFLKGIYQQYVKPISNYSGNIDIGAYQCHPERSEASVSLGRDASPCSA